MSTDAINHEWKPDWASIANHAVNSTLRLQRGERVVYLGDPLQYPSLFDEVRASVLKAGGIEQATILAWSPRLASLRTSSGLSDDPELAVLERRAHWELFNTADVFIWLPPTTFDRAGSYSTMETEWIVDRWRGRSIHIHWPLDPLASTGKSVNLAIQQMGQRAILDLDVEVLSAQQQRLIDALRGHRIRITTPQGTDLSFDSPVDSWYYANDGDCSREKALSATCARDRTQELPCGVVRTIPAPASVNGVVRLREKPLWVSSAASLSAFADDLDIVLVDGRISEFRSAKDIEPLKQAATRAVGSWDRLAEVVFGMNPLIENISGASFPPYWGYEAGLVRLHFGENVESGGTLHTDLPLNTFLNEATVVADGIEVLRQGRIVI